MAGRHYKREKTIRISLEKEGVWFRQEL